MCAEPISAEEHARERWSRASFRGKRGPYTDRGIRNVLAVLGRQADVSHVHPHRFRHDTARRLVEHVDLPTVAALLGHSRLDTVARPRGSRTERAVKVRWRSLPR
jgi:integrase